MHFFVVFAVPPPKLYVQVNPIQINFDLRSCLWANAFVLNLKKSLEEAQPEQIPDIFYIDVKLEAIKIMVGLSYSTYKIFNILIWVAT